MRGGAVITCTAALAFAVLAGVLHSVRTAPLPDISPPLATPEIRDTKGRTFHVLSSGPARECYPRSLHQLGPWLPLVTVAIEDRRFRSHCGVDLAALARSAAANLATGRIASGGSTITQQLVKMTTGAGERTLRRKAEEMLAALALERAFDKDALLEAYLNRLDYGNRRIGPEAAARAYFGKPASHLTLAEAIFLAGLPQSPTRLNPWLRPDLALARYQRNVDLLARTGVLQTDPNLLRESPPTVLRKEAPAAAPAFARASDGGLSSLDQSIQSASGRLAFSHAAAARACGAEDLAVVVIENATGLVRAMVTHTTPRHRGVNAAMVPRSSGSTLKPFLYAEALERRVLTAASLLPDTPDGIRRTYSDYDPRNFTRRHLGPVRLREALGNSLNVPAVATLQRLGARGVFAALARWHLPVKASFNDVGAGFILGNSPVTLVDLTASYASLARGGRAWAARFSPFDQPTESRGSSREVCAIVADILADNSARVRSFGTHSPLNVGARVPVKTGTSSAFRDGWCVGFTADHTVGVWAGNLDGRPMAGALAFRTAAPLWAAVVRFLLENGDAPFPVPTPSDALTCLPVADQTGLLPTSGEPTVSEWFLAGTEPTEASSTMMQDGVLTLPPEYAQWCASTENTLGARVRSGPIRIAFPQEGAVFEVSRVLPASQQVLIARATKPDCEWLLNGSPLANPRIPLRRGEWTLTARDPDGEHSVRIRVE